MTTPTPLMKITRRFKYPYDKMNAHDNATAPNPKQTTAVSTLNPVHCFIVDLYILLSCRGVYFT